MLGTKKKILAHFYGDLWITPFERLLNESIIELSYTFLEDSMSEQKLHEIFPKTRFVSAETLRIGEAPIPVEDKEQEVGRINNTDVVLLINSLYEYEPIILSMLQREGIYDELKSLINWRILYYKIIFNILNLLNSVKPDVVFFSEIPHNYGSYLLYLLARKLNIQTLMLVMPMELKGYIYAVNAFESGNKLISQFSKDNTFNEDITTNFSSLEITDQILRLKSDYKAAIPDYVKANLTKGKTKLISIAHLKIMLERRKKGIKLHSTLLQRIFKRLKTFYWHQRLPKIYRKLSQNVDLNANYVYFALHYQPEQTSVPLAGYFENQFYTAALISKNLPRGWRLYIKENPYQFIKMEPSHIAFKGKFFYESLCSLPNTYLLPMTYDNFEIIDKSKGVMTLTGMIGWEAINRKKPCAVFGYATYVHCEGITKINNENDLKIFYNLLQNDNYKINETKIEEYLKLVRSIAYKGILKDFEFNIYHITEMQNNTGWYECLKYYLHDQNIYNHKNTI